LPVEIAETEQELKIRAEVPGFTASDLKVSVEPQQVIITGKSEKSDQKKDEKTPYTELSTNEIMRVLDLPARVDPSKATAVLRDGVLELLIPKLAATEPVKIEVKAE
jgi:HSP20 family protein